MKTRVQIIGTYLEDLIPALEEKNIWVESVINKLNPITVMYEPDMAKQHFGYDIDDESAVLDIRKNLGQFLSHEKDKFQSNVNLQDAGKEVRYENNSEYLLFYNSYLNCKIIQYKGALYTHRAPKNKFMEEIINEGAVVNEFTFLKTIDWKHYFDKFIEVILNEYSSEKIILLRNSVGPWYVDSDGIKRFVQDFREYFELAEEMDNYFIQKTGCICINDFYASVSDRNPNCIAPTSLRSKKVLESVAERIANIIYGTEKVTNELKSLTQKENTFDLVKLCLQVQQSGELTEDDFRKVEAYIKAGFFDINDIIAVYNLFSDWKERYDFREILKNIISSKSSVAVSRAKSFFEQNKRYLLVYPYVAKDNKYTECEEEICINLERGFYFYISIINQTCKMELMRYKEEARYTFQDIKKSNFYCSLECLEFLCGDLRFYVERAKGGHGNTPLKVKFLNERDFVKTLYFIDWKNLLESEHFVIEVPGKVLEKEDYIPRTDLTVFFEDSTKIFRFIGGFGDQIRLYLVSKYIEKYSDCTFFYDDIIYKKHKMFYGFELPKVLIQPIEDRLLSNLFSPLLLKNNFNCIEQMQFADDLFEAGLTDIVVIGDAGIMQKVKKAGMYLPNQNEIKYLGRKKFPLQYYCISQYHLPFGPRAYEFYSKYIRFPEFKTEKNIEMEKKMLSCDAVSLHIRRGDFVSYGCEISTEYFKESIKKLTEISDYSDKQFFVFSDDVSWCREHKNELGFDYFPNSPVYFVDHNKGEESYRDMQLLSLSKIIISSIGGFANTAAAMSKRIEIHMSPRDRVISEFKIYGTGNKYDMGSYSRDYLADNKPIRSLSVERRI